MTRAQHPKTNGKRVGRPRHIMWVTNLLKKNPDGLPIDVITDRLKDRYHHSPTRPQLSNILGKNPYLYCKLGWKNQKILWGWTGNEDE